MFYDPFGAETPTLTHLTLGYNRLTSISGEFLPATLTHLDLSNNQLAVFDAITCLPELFYLRIDSNFLDELPHGIQYCFSLKFLIASNNRISKLPVGFEDLELLVLDLADNHFTFDNSDPERDLYTCLWNRLPQNMDVLILSGNSLRELPCSLSSRGIWKLQANDCHLRYICPRIFAQNYHNFGPYNILEVERNEDLDYLSFVPTTIYHPPKAHDPHGRFKNGLGKMRIISDRRFHNTSKWHTTQNVHNYSFVPIQNEDDQNPCHCCARCGADCSGQRGRIETFMIMDFTLAVITPASKNQSEVINKYGPGEWKTVVKTKMCEACVTAMKKDIDDLYSQQPLPRKTAKKLVSFQTFLLYFYRASLGWAWYMVRFVGPDRSGIQKIWIKLKSDFNISGRSKTDPSGFWSLSCERDASEERKKG